MFFLLLRKKPKEKEDKEESLKLLQQQLNYISQTLDNKLSESNKIIQVQFGQSAKIIRDVTEKLTKLDETNKQVVGFAAQLQSLENVFKTERSFGGILFRRIIEECF